MIASQLGLAIVLCAASQAGAITGITSGGSLVFTRAHNVWLTSADGATQRPPTTDGTTDAPYRSPSQSADGSIVAMVRDRRRSGAIVVSYLYEVDRQARSCGPRSSRRSTHSLSTTPRAPVAA